MNIDQAREALKFYDELDKADCSVGALLHYSQNVADALRALLQLIEEDHSR